MLSVEGAKIPAKKGLQEVASSLLVKVHCGVSESRSRSFASLLLGNMVSITILPRNMFSDSGIFPLMFQVLAVPK